MSIEVVFAIAGVIALLIGIIGGGVKAKEIEFPVLPLPARVTTIAIGIIFIGLTVFLETRIQTTMSVTPTVAPVETPSATLTTFIPTPAPTINPEQSTKTIVLHASDGSQKVEKGQIIVLANEKGVAIIKFSFSVLRALYQWRYQAYGEDVVKTGIGEVFEKYACTPTADGGEVCFDDGGQLEIVMEDIKVGWSYSGPDSGWIYFKSLGVAVFDEEMYDTLDLSTIRVAD